MESNRAESESPVVLRCKALPSHGIMADNPHYDGNNSTEIVNNKESQFPSAFRNQKCQDYRVIPSSCLEILRELGEGVFGKVHLASFQSHEDRDAKHDNFLVAVSI